MTIFDSILLGFIQALTEFLPISSSGHLVLTQKILGYNLNNLIFEVILHFGTLFSIIIFFWNDLKKIFLNFILNDKKTKQFIIKIIIATLPASIVGLLFKDKFIYFFYNLITISIAFFFTGLILFSTKFIKKNNGKLNFTIAFFVGIAQVFALFPGISRSGITIATSLILGVDRKESARFSFMLAIPILLGASILQFKEILMLEEFPIYESSFGFVSALLFGLVMIKILFNIVYNNYFWIFSFYCFFISIITFLIR